MVRSLRDVSAVLELARLGNFGRAAVALGMTQSALTRHLQKIEEQLGVPLFDRAPRGVTPTIFGRIVIERGDVLLRCFADIARDIELARHGETGELRIVAAMFPAAVSVKSVVAELAHKFPRLRLRLMVKDQPDAVRALYDGEADIGVLSLPNTGDEDLSSRPLPHRKHVFYCRAGHPLAMFPDASTTDIARYPLAGFRMTRRMTPFQDAEIAGVGSLDPVSGEFVPNILVNSFSAALAIVTCSNAISWAPLRLIRESVAAGAIVPLSFASDEFECAYDIVWPSGRSLHPAAETFMELLTTCESGSGETERAAESDG